MEKINDYDRCLTSSIFERMLEEYAVCLLICSNVIDMRRTEAAKGCFQLPLMEHAQPRQSMNNKTSRKRIPTFVLDGTPDTPFTKSSLPKEQGPNSHLNLLGHAKVFLELGKVTY